MVQLFRKKPNESTDQQVNWFENSSNVENNFSNPVNETADQIAKENKRIKTNSSLKELEFYNSLSQDDKENYRIQALNKKKLVVNLVCLALTLLVWFGTTFTIKSHLNSVVERNEELKSQADALQADIKKLSNTEVLLEDVAVSWLMSKSIYDQRDEVLDLLASVEALTPNDLTFKLNKIQRNWAFNYKIDYELVPKDDPTSLNKAIVDTAYMFETIAQSKTILSLADRDAYHFEITEFKWSAYSKSTKTFPLSITVKMVKDKTPAKANANNKQAAN